MELFESYAIIAVTCISVLLTILYNVQKKGSQDFRGKRELKNLIFSLVAVFIAKELQYIFTYFYTSSIIPYKVVASIFIALYYIVYATPLVTVTIYLYSCISRNLSKPVIVFLWVPVFIMGILAIISIFTPCLFSVSDEGKLIYGPLYPYLATISFIYMIYDIFVAVKFRFMLEKGSFMTFIPMFIAPFTALLIFYIFIFILKISFMSLIWIAMTITMMIHYFTFIQDKLNTTDQLTHLANKQRLINFIDKVFNSKRREDIYGFMLDLDKFKSINDTYGHDVGDYALFKASEILMKASPSNAFIARYAGDEFIVIIPSSDHQTPGQFAKRLEEEENEFNKSSDGELFNLHFSLGYSFFSKDEKYDTSSFLRIIDQKMYADKRNASKKKEDKYDLDFFYNNNIDYRSAIYRFNKNVDKYYECLDEFISKEKCNETMDILSKDNKQQTMNLLNNLYVESTNLSLGNIEKAVSKLISLIVDNNDYKTSVEYEMLKEELRTSYLALINSLGK